VGWWQALTLHGCVSQAKALVTEALKRLAGFNRRTLDALAARLYFYYSWAHECTGTLADIRRWPLDRPPTHRARAATRAGGEAAQQGAAAGDGAQHAAAVPLPALPRPHPRHPARVHRCQGLPAAGRAQGARPGPA